ncbi:penicillin-binding protein 1A [bacterium BMS3Bbin01]|nr:penicillin-binding protein 1A [bacterium BMS3Bbin01]
MSAPIHELERREVRSRWFVALATLLSVALLASTWLALFSFFGTSSAFGVFTGLEKRFVPDVQNMALDFPDLSRVSRIYTLSNQKLAELDDGKNSQPIRIEDVPEIVIDGALASEDATFYEHEGVNFAAIGSAFIDNLRYGKERGGSTITQQVVKQNFVGDEPTLTRKIREAAVAVELERRYTKDQILEFYLNSVYFGWGAYGVKAAAQEYFGKSLDELTIAESAAMFVPIRNPRVYDPRRQPENVLQRRNDVIDTMVAHDMITKSQGEAAKKEPLDIRPPSRFNGPADHVVAEVKRQLLHDPEFAFLGATSDERKKAVFGCPADDTSCQGGGGLKVFVTIDLDLQEKANSILESWLPYPDPTTLSKEDLDACISRYNATRTAVPSIENLRCAPTGAISMVDNVTGAIQVISSGLPFDIEQFDLALRGQRNPGSAFKPFGLVAYLESGGSLNSFWDARSPLEIECPYTCSDNPKNPNIWTVSNAGGSIEPGLRLFDATRRSVNVVYAQVAVQVGPAHIKDVARRMGVKKSEIPEVYSIVLGAGGATPIEMASAFSNFATNGLWAEPYLIERIEGPDGSVLYEHVGQRLQVVDPAIIAAARRPLRLVPTNAGTAPKANIGRPQGGKTGTHQNFMDAWFVGFVPQYSTAVWVGYPDFQYPMRNVTINNQFYSRVFGGSVPAPIWAEFMTAALAGVPDGSFPDDPPGVNKYYEVPPATVPNVVGMIADAVGPDGAPLPDGGAGITTAKDAVYAAHLQPVLVEVDSLEPVGTVVAQSPPPGASWTNENGQVVSVAQGDEVTLSVSTGLPPTAPLPDFTGLTVADVVIALDQLKQDTGVELDFTTVPVITAEPSLYDVVITTSPAPGFVVTYGDPITLFVGAPPVEGGG